VGEDVEVVDKEVEGDHWENAAVLVIVLIGPQFVVSGGIVKQQTNQTETLTLVNVDLVQIVPLGLQYVLDMDIVS